MNTNGFSLIDPAAETGRLVQLLREVVTKKLRKRRAVVGISGGVDSSVAFSLCVRAFGPQQVIALILSERDSSPDSERLARKLACDLAVDPIKEDITAALEGFGCYRRRDDAVRRVFPEFDADAGYKVKISLPSNPAENGSLNVFSITIVTPSGEVLNKPLPTAEFLQIVAASNFKQRTRMAFLYYHAELNNGAVIGTANKNEHDQGFFVKFGDSGVDVRLLGHLCKSQIYSLAKYLNVPAEIQRRPPTSDTYSAPCTQEEFFFRMPFAIHDKLLLLADSGVSPETAATELGISEKSAKWALADIASKRRAAEYLQTPPISFALESENRSAI